MTKIKSPMTKIALSLALSTALAACTSDLPPSQPVAQGKASQLTPYQQRAFQDEVFYFVLPDRFYNGDPNNDLGAAANDSKRALSHGGLDRQNKGMYHGGDLAGLSQKLPYLDQMGITAIWLTPLLRNRAIQANSSGYHGYWILDFTEIDPHWGTNEELKNLIAQAHKRNIKVYFDIITNHTADVIKYKECHGPLGIEWLVENDHCQFKASATLADDHYTPLIPAKEESVKVPSWLNNIDYYHNQGDSHWSGESAIKGDFAGLDDIKTTDPTVVKGMIDIYKNLITEFKPDGFRIDTVKHVDMAFWQQFSPALMEHAKSQGINNFMMFGEAYSFDAKFLSQFMTTGKMPSVLDFALAGTIEAVLVNKEGTDKLAGLFAQDHFYQTEQGFNANHLVNFVGNHDMGRFAYKLASSDNNYSESEIIKRTLLAHALIYFSRGIPVVYYGTEQGFVGDGGDQDARQDMMPSLVNSYNDDNLLATNSTTADDNFDKNHMFYQRFSKYSALYQRYPALRKGQQTTRYAQSTPGLFAIERTIKNQSNTSQKVLVVFNTSTQRISIDTLALSQPMTLIHSENKGSDKTIDGLSFNLYLLP